MKRMWTPTRRSVRKVGYNVIEIQKASHSLSEAIDSGSLSWLKAKFEHCPMEAVPNVWEGDEGMMKHVPKFPMPPCIVLPLQEGAVGSAPAHHKSDTEPDDAGLFQGGDMEADKAYTEFGFELKRRGMERKFWIKMAKLVMSIESLNQSTMTLRNKFCQVNMKIKKHDCQHLLNLYTQMQKIKYKLDKADEDYKNNEFTDLFVTMQPSKKTWFKRRHEIQGKLPNNLGCIVKKYSFVRTKLREIIHKNFERLEEFKDILSIILKDAFMKFNKDSLALKVYTEADGNKNGEASCVGADKADENTDEGLDEEGNSKKAKLENVEDAIMSLEDIFWENLTTMKKMMHKAATTLGRIDKATLPDNSNVFKKNGSLMCRQMLNIRKSIISFNDTLVKLKEEMQSENYEDKKLFTAEMLASEGIEGLTTDNSLLVVEALLNQLKDNYLRVQDEKYFVLEKFGYSKDVELVAGPTGNDENLPLVRICTHSRTEVDIKIIARLAQGQSYYNKKGKKRGSTSATGEKTNKATVSPDAGTDGQQNPSAGGTDVIPSGDLSSEEAAGNKDVNPGVETSEDVAVDRSTDGGDSVPMDENAEDDGASESSEDSSNICKNVNSLSFFMSTLAPDAFTVNVQSSVSATTEDFIEKEKQYWDRMQKLLRDIDTLMKQVRVRATNNYWRKRQIRDAMKALHHRIKKLSANFELEKVEAFRAGYCTHVVYENLEYYPDSSTAILVKSLDQIKQRINTMYRCYKETTEKLGVPWMFKM